MFHFALSLARITGPVLFLLLGMGEQWGRVKNSTSVEQGCLGYKEPGRAVSLSEKAGVHRIVFPLIYHLIFSGVQHFRQVLNTTDGTL